MQVNPSRLDSVQEFEAPHHKDLFTLGVNFYLTQMYEVVLLSWEIFAEGRREQRARSDHLEKVHRIEVGCRQAEFRFHQTDHRHLNLPV